MRPASLGGCALAMALAASALAVGLKQSTLLCHGRWCLRPATKQLQDGPNAVQFPIHHFCERCYSAFIASRRERRSQERSGKILIGNQLLDRNSWKASASKIDHPLAETATEQSIAPPEQRSVGFAW